MRTTTTTFAAASGQATATVTITVAEAGAVEQVSGTEECVVDEDGGQTCRVVGEEEDDGDDGEEDEDDGCYDMDQSCGDFSGVNECIEDFLYASERCRKTCKLCDNYYDDESNDEFLRFVDNPYSENPQRLGSIRTELAVVERNEGFVRDVVDRYMYETVYAEEKYGGVLTDCKNRHEWCTYWANAGECEANPEYMEIHCAPSCRSCHKLSFELRCPFDAAENPGAWNKSSGNVDDMFARILDEYGDRYGAVVYSAPSSFPPSRREKFRPPERKEYDARTRDGPWVVVLDDFLSRRECDELIELGASQGYEISKDVGKRQFDGTYDAHVSKDRTSTNAWCVEECYRNSTTMDVLHRIEDLVQVPEINYEYLQLLRYEENQFYGRHHDYIGHHVARAQGVRILTVFLYLNDVERGGGTHFPLLNVTVMPKRGRVLLWPSVLDKKPDSKDRRTEHQALPVEKGIKYGANAWVHQRDFKTPWANSCH